MLREYAKVMFIPRYFLYWIGLFVTDLGSQVGSLALTWMIIDQTGSPLALAAVLALRQIPIALGSLWVGPLMDRMPRRTLMILDNIIRGVIWFITVALLVSRGATASIWVVYIAVTLTAFLSSFTMVGHSAITPALVDDPALLPAANALNQIRSQASFMAGPAVAGILLHSWSPATIVLVDAASFFFFALVLILVKVEPLVPKQVRTSYWQSLREGVQSLWSYKPLLFMTGLTFFFNCAYGPLAASLPFYTKDVLGLGADGLAALWTAFAAGILLGSFASTSVAKLRLGIGLAVIPIAWGVFTGLLAVFRTSAIAMLLMALAGASFAPYGILSRTVTQQLASDEVRGRIFALTFVITQMGTPAGAWAGGLLMLHLGATPTIAFAAVASVLLGMSVLAKRQFRQMAA